MSPWLRKATSILITVLTLGVVTPPYILHNETSQESLSRVESEQAVQYSSLDYLESESSSIESEIYPPVSWDETTWQTLSETIFDRNLLEEQFTAYMTYQAKVQAQKKFGPVIGARVGDEYDQVILPKFEQVLTHFSRDADETLLRHVEVTSNPAPGLGEKIYHLYDVRNGEDVVRFHVRREKPPQDGYWFSFHYHKREDQFQHHHELGKIYWDKNTPPRWVS